MFRIAAVFAVLMAFAAESQAQWRPFGGRFRCQPQYNQCPQPQYYGQCQPGTTYYIVPQTQYTVPGVPSSPMIVPTPTQPEFPKVVPVKEPEKVVTPKNDGPKIVPAPKRN